MKILKVKTKDGWVSLYVYLLKQALFAKNNLSDLLDKEEARENLELTGNNNHTHYHDDRYIPIIKAANDDVLNQLQDFRQEVEEKDALSSFEGNIVLIETLKNGWYKWVGTLDNVTGTWIITKMDTLYSATCINDPRIVLNSIDLEHWYSPYGYWHA